MLQAARYRMLNQVFISYRHESSEHSRAVRRFGELLRQASVPVLLDQFYLEDHPGGPDDGWPKWCEDCANQSACVLIVASKGWFAAYDKTEPSGQGLGAATEADLFRQDIWNNKGHNERIRLTFLHSMANDSVPVRLQAWHQFRPFDSAGPDELIRWLATRLGLQVTEESAVKWPESIHFQPDIANRNKNEWPAVVGLLSGKSDKRILLFEGGSGLGKSELVRHARTYGKKLGLPVAYIDFKSGIIKTTEDILGLIDLELGEHLPIFSKSQPKASSTLRKDLRALRQPVLVIFDSYEDIAGNQTIVDWLNIHLLGDLESSPAIAVIIAGQKVPDQTHASWRDLAHHFPLSLITELEHWKEWASRRYPNVPESALNTLLQLAGGQPSLMVVYCQTIAKAGAQ
jgi:hypothetical protein